MQSRPQLHVVRIFNTIQEGTRLAHLSQVHQARWLHAED